MGVTVVKWAYKPLNTGKVFGVDESIGDLSLSEKATSGDNSSKMVHFSLKTTLCKVFGDQPF